MRLREILLLSAALLIISIASSEIFADSSASNFNKGTFDNTTYNATAGYLQLDLNSNANGSYTSQIFDAGSVVTWRNLSWVPGVGYQTEFPNNGIAETGPGGADMSKNVLLLHLNNDADYGEGSSKVFDFSGNGNNGTWIGTASANTKGKFGKGANIPGNNRNYLRAPDSASLDITKEISMEFWVYFDAITRSDTLLYKNKAYGIKLPGFNSDRIECMFYRRGWKNVKSSNAAIQTGKWHHVVCTLDSDEPEQLKVYVDGQLTGSNTGIFGRGNIKTSNYNLHLGCNHKGKDCFNGRLDEIAIYNRILSQKEVEDHYKRGILKFNTYARSCDDSLCSGESFSEVGNSAELEVSENRYFQYKFGFETGNSLFSPALYNVTVNYEDTIPPAPVSNLTNTSRTDASITWSWKNPSDVDFNSSIIYLNGINVINTSNEIYNATNLTPETSYAINLYTKDHKGNINSNSVSSSAKTLPTPDLIPPDAVANLTSQFRTNESIYWIWVNPKNPDLNESVVYLNGKNKLNTTEQFFNATNLTANSNYTITVYTKDDAGNINNTNVTDTAATLSNVKEEHSKSSGGGSGGSSGRSGRSSTDCVPDWECTESECSPNGTKVISCTDTAGCGGFRPDTTKSCLYSEESNNLFDVGLELTTEQVDEKLVAAVTLINIGSENSTNVTLIYKILDEFDAAVLEEKETIEVETQKQFTKEFDISSLESGQYTLLAEIEYEGQTEAAQSQQTFAITGAAIGAEKPDIHIRILPILLVFAFFGVVLTANYRRFFGKFRKKPKKSSKSLPDGKFYSSDIYGKKVISEKGSKFGEVKDITFLTSSGELIDIIAKQIKPDRKKHEVTIPYHNINSIGDFVIISDETNSKNEQNDKTKKQKLGV